MDHDNFFSLFTRIMCSFKLCFHYVVPLVAHSTILHAILSMNYIISLDSIFHSDFWKTPFFRFSRIVNEITPEIIVAWYYGLERYIRTEGLHTMTEGMCYVVDSLKVASVIHSELL